MDVDERPMEHGCDDIWSWNRFERSPEVKVYGQTMRVAHFHPNWSSGTAGIRGNKSLNGGRYYWELHISQRIFGTSMMFGVGTRKTRLHADSFTNLLGEDKNGWGLSHKGLLWHDGEWYHYTRPFRENEATTVGVLFDGIAGTLTYYKDGKCLGVAFRDLNKIMEPLFPIICSTAAKTEMTLKNMRREYVNLQDRCRDAIVKRIHYKDDLDKLLVPDQIKKFLGEVIEPVNQFHEHVSITF